MSEKSKIARSFRGAQRGWLLIAALVSVLGALWMVVVGAFLFFNGYVSVPPDIAKVIGFGFWVSSGFPFFTTIFIISGLRPLRGWEREIICMMDACEGKALRELVERYE